jgi:hypothetical protein
MRISNTGSLLQTNALIVHVVLVCAIAQETEGRLPKSGVVIQPQPSGARFVMHKEALG